MHMPDTLRTSLLMQIVNILGYKHKLPIEIRLQLRQRQMCWVGRYRTIQNRSAPLIIEPVY